MRGYEELREGLSICGRLFTELLPSTEEGSRGWNGGYLYAQTDTGRGGGLS